MTQTKTTAKKPAPKKANVAAKGKKEKKAKAAKPEKPAKVVKNVLKPISERKMIVLKPGAKSPNKPVITLKPGTDEKKRRRRPLPLKLDIKKAPPKPMPAPKFDLTKPAPAPVAIVKKKKHEDSRNRYSDKELKEFKQLIKEKLDASRTELKYLQDQINRKDDNGTDDTENKFGSIDDGTVAMEREYLNQMAERQSTYIDHLEKALLRIENKTYGICRVTGKLIDKERLRAVPHATLSIEAKMQQAK
mgnify:FL=1